MFKALKAWRRQRVLRASTLDQREWRRVVRRLPLLDGLSADELGRLKELCILFMHDKEIHGAVGLALDDRMRLTIAAQACLPILNLDIDDYSGWVEVIVYADEFVPRHEVVDEAGVVHITRHPLAGEAWLGGPVVLSWADVNDACRDDGVNVVIHEFAHKLDMRNGDVNGFPPLHPGMSREAWSRAFSAAYADFCRQVDAGVDTAIDPYAAESPAEFFAVLTEAFFETPRVVKQCYPDVYTQLSAYYRQDTALRQYIPIEV